MTEGGNCKRLAGLITTFFVTLLYSGTLFGWASLVYVFKQDGVFSQLCSDETDTANRSAENAIPNNQSGSVVADGAETEHTFPTCVAQDKMLSFAFTASSIVFGVFSFPIGIFFDKFGLRITRSIIIILAASAYLMLGFADYGDSSWLVFVGGPILGITCSSYIMMNSQVASLAGDKTSSVLTLYGGAVNVSAAVFLIVKLVSEYDVMRRYSMSVVAGLLIIDVINSWILLPKFKAQHPDKTTEKKTNHDGFSPLDQDEPRKQLKQELEATFNKNEGEVCLNKKDTGLDDQHVVIPAGAAAPSFSACVRTPSCWLHLIWFALLNLRLMTFIGTFNPWLTDAVGGDLNRVSHFTNILGYIQIVSLVAAPISGMLMDMQRKKVDKRGIQGVARSILTFPSLLICGVMSLTLSAVTLIQHQYAIYAAIIFFEMGRSFIYGTGVAYIEVTFPGMHFGKIFGLAYLINGVTVFLQYPLLLWATRINNFIPMNIFLLAINICSLVHPLIIWLRFRLRN